MAKVIISKSMAQAAAKSMFSPSEWKPVGDPVNLKDLWEVTNPGLYDEIEGETAEVTAASFKDGTVGMRITISFKDGETMDLRLSGKSDLEEGDLVSISSITAQELKKVGRDTIVRYDAEVA